MDCLFQPTDDSRIFRCTRCGEEYRVRGPLRESISRQCRKPGLGDHVAIWFAAVGIYKPKKCGCRRRQDWLNRLGTKLGF